MQSLGDGSIDMIASTMGWDLNPRILGTVPKEAKVQALSGFTWVMDGQFIIVPKGISDDKLAVVLDLIEFCLKPNSKRRSTTTASSTRVRRSKA